MTFLLHLSLGFALSFIGSIPFGSINLTVTESAITRGFRTAAWVALGAAMIEFVQALVALKFSSLITRNAMTMQIMLWLSIPIFIVLGIYFFKQKFAVGESAKPYRAGRGFLKGVIVSSLNVLAIPYWIFYASILVSFGWIALEFNRHILWFAIGIFLGAMSILLIFARLGIYAKTKFANMTKYASPMVGAIFFGLAVIQVIRVVNGG